MIGYEAIRIKSRRAYLKCTYKKRRKKIKNNNFTIISNNCWGGFIYQSYGEVYNTPTIGLFFMADDYIKFLEDIKGHLKYPIKFIKPEESKWYEELKHTHKFGLYPVGILNDIEIFFMHYKNEEEVLEKWNKRCKRINWEKLLIKFNDQNGCKEKHLHAFQQLNYSNKICFISKKSQYNLSNIDPNIIRIPCPNETILASYEPFGKSKYLNINTIINKL